MTYDSDAPAGWYPLGSPGQYRWWDGRTWTPHMSYPLVAPTVLPAETVPAPVEAAVPTHTPASWLLAVLPLWVIVISGVLSAAEASPVVMVLVLGAALTVLSPISLGLSLWDLATLRARGSSLSMAHALWSFLGAYLIARAILLKGSDRERWALIAVSIVAGLAATVALIGISFVFASDVDVRRAVLYNQTFTEREIQTAFLADTGRRVNVECPDNPPIASGESFTCEMTTPSGRIIGTAIVTWENNFGMYSWTTGESGAPLTDQA